MVEKADEQNAEKIWVSEWGWVVASYEHDDKVCGPPPWPGAPMTRWQAWWTKKVRYWLESRLAGLRLLFCLRDLDDYL